MTVRRSNAALKRAALLLMLAVACGAAFSFWVGGQLLAPRPATIGAPPPDLHAEVVAIAGKAGTVRGWWIEGDADKASVLLLHGIRGNRLAMVGRARMLAKHGYPVLLLDLPAHGQSDGDSITLGLRESRGVQSARAWMQARRPGKAVAAVGVSLGGASILLGPSPSGFDAVVLEAVYPDARQALQNRMEMRVGRAAPWLGKLLEWQLEPRLGISPEQLRPIDHIAALGAPVLVIAGGRDRHTTPTQSAALFARASDPKEYWLLPEATHQDFERFTPAEYEARVISFLERSLAAHCSSDAPASPPATATVPSCS